jgi:peptidyl-tRNA hydrolase, PTH1 family
VEAVAASRHLTLRKPFFHLYEWTGRPDESRMTLARPLTYMNRSGSVLPNLLKRTRSMTSDLLVVCDNLDLPAGSVRLKRKGSARSHNGLASIMDALGAGDFMRLYIGIGRPADGMTVVDHVLGIPPEDETEIYTSAIALAASSVEALLTQPPDAVMNSLNRRP